jgi:hypothetical protein
MGKLAISEKGAEFEFNKEDQEFVTKISKHNFFGIIGDHIAMWRWQNVKLPFSRTPRSVFLGVGVAF